MSDEYAKYELIRDGKSFVTITVRNGQIVYGPEWCMGRAFGGLMPWWEKNGVRVRQTHTWTGANRKPLGNKGS